ncbi:XRE family transcriptional regulator [Streptococcus dysgalactiae]|uniref:XRE family transcriptional regulator n=1 Tax=Streptococcus dysgalactiae TaxID=1334 RepID=UPI000D88C2E8|nr:XRE family transcriptional regulator [Streptococcus dysgalactiae]QBX23429.1 hypothetical protein Javan128_0055 [Streptococcus phage Javan128]GET71023.1 hypothetical protein KNZ03_15820 [Streptococcus dysgalactiae subsp. equisimilis]SQB83335.1 Uncharacterised protein [Streptococcus dysgalactiae]
MKADKKEIEWLLDNVTQYSIAKETGITQSKLSNLKTGKIKIENLSLKIASDLTNYAKKIKNT